MAVYAMGLNVVFGRLFGVATDVFMPWVICGIISWSLLAALINEASNLFMSFRGFILQSDRPLLVYPAYAMARHVMVFFHHLLAAIAVLIFFGKFQVQNLLLMVAFLPMFVFAIGWLIVTIAIVSTRYRDIPPILSNVMQVSFFLTPVMFMPASLPDIANLLMFNPFGQLIDLLREPLLGRIPSFHTLAFTGGAGVVGWVMTILLYRRTRNRVAYWL